MAGAAGERGSSQLGRCGWEQRGLEHVELRRRAGKQAQGRRAQRQLVGGADGQLAQHGHALLTGELRREEAHGRVLVREQRAAGGDEQLGGSTAFLVIGGVKHDTLLGLWFGILACLWFMVGSVFLVRQRLNHQELVLLKELKGLEGRLLELQQSLQQQGPAR